jgi:hypothetical protein
MPDVPSKIYLLIKDANETYLYDGSLAGDFKNLTLSDGSIS